MSDETQAAPFGDYAIELTYEPNTSRPAELFLAMSGLVDAFRVLDVSLARSVSAEIEPVVVLREIEIGSLRVWLSTVLKSIDDSALEKLDWKKIVGKYLVQAKHRVLEWLDASDNVKPTPDGIRAVQADLVQLAEETNVLHLPTYRPVPVGTLVTSANRVSESVRLLDKDGTAVFRSEQEVIQIRRDFFVSDSVVDELVEQEVHQADNEVVLRVKKPDLLGHSKWDLKLGDRAISASISDEDWLLRYHGREVDLRPGDSIRAVLRSRLQRDRQGHVLSERYEVLRVLEVIPAADLVQLELGESSSTDADD